MESPNKIYKYEKMEELSMVSKEEKMQIRIKGLQRRIELTTVKQLHRYERTGDMGKDLDKELNRYVTILNGLRKEAAIEV